jgi:hypothetical protein
MAKPRSIHPDRWNFTVVVCGEIRRRLPHLTTVEGDQVAR